MKWKISFPIDGLSDVISSKECQIGIDDVTFHYRTDSERVGTVIVEKIQMKKQQRKLNI